MTSIKYAFIYLISGATLLAPVLGQSDELSYKDIPYTFEVTKLIAANNSFHFLRSFVDLFYLSYVENQAKFPIISSLKSETGWCVGDAHAENFGVLLQDNGTPLFTMNDVDDSGPCPVTLDLFRLLVSTRLYDPSIDLEKLVHAYARGLKGEQFEMPLAIKEMMTKAERKGEGLSKKKESKGHLKRTPLMENVNPTERTQILAALSHMRLSPGYEVLDMVSTSKVGGGSGGLLRYEVLLMNGDQHLQIEFKEEVKASIYPVAPNLPNTKTRIEKTLFFNQGAGASRFYTVTKINEKDMFVRPRFSGNIGVSLKNQDADQNAEIIKYEAYTLGQIHAHSLERPKPLAHKLKEISHSSIEAEVDTMTHYFQAKFDALKAK